MKKIVAVFMTVLLLVCLLTACGEGKELLGRWHTSDDGANGGFVFEKDGTGKIFQGTQARDITWSASGGKLTVSVSGVTMINEAEYVVEENVLYVTYQGSTVSFAKK